MQPRAPPASQPTRCGAQLVGALGFRGRGLLVPIGGGAASGTCPFPARVAAASARGADGHDEEVAAQELEALAALIATLAPRPLPALDGCRRAVRSPEPTRCHRANVRPVGSPQLLEVAGGHLRRACTRQRAVSPPVLRRTARSPGLTTAVPRFQLLPKVPNRRLCTRPRGPRRSVSGCPRGDRPESCP